MGLYDDDDDDDDDDDGGDDADEDAAEVDEDDDDASTIFDQVPFHLDDDIRRRLSTGFSAEISIGVFNESAIPALNDASTWAKPGAIFRCAGVTQRPTFGSAALNKRRERKPAVPAKIRSRVLFRWMVAG